MKWSLHPRWYLAARAGVRARSARIGHDETFEAVVAYRPAAGHLLKAGYLVHVGLPVFENLPNRIFGLQYVVSLNPPALAAW